MGTSNCENVTDTLNKMLDDLLKDARSDGTSHTKEYLKVNVDPKYPPEFYYDAIDENIREVSDVIWEYVSSTGKFDGEILPTYTDKINKVTSFIDQHKDECKLPDERNVHGIIENSFRDGIREVAEPFVIAFIDGIYFDCFACYEDEKYIEIPKELFDFLHRRDTAVKQLDFIPAVPPKLDIIDLSHNEISDFCRLDELEANEIRIYNNPIKKIRFKDKKQFLNVLTINPFDESELPDDLKSEILECRSQIRTINSLISAKIFKDVSTSDGYYSITDKDVEKYFTYADACKDVYEKIQNSDMCRE